MKYEKIELKVPGQQTGPAVLTAYMLDALSVAPEKKRPVVIVVPGGAYAMRSDREKEPVALRFLAMGYHACILDYSVAPNRFPVALQELALAVATVRRRAEAWHADPGRIFVCGFSAGGHLACSLGTFWEKPFVWEPVLELLGDQVMGQILDPGADSSVLGHGAEKAVRLTETCGEGAGSGQTALWIQRAAQIRPDGLILCYPVVTSGEYCHAGSFQNLLGEEADQEKRELVSLENQVTPAMPPVFLWHTVTDESVPVENSLLLASALRQAGVSLEMHLYPRGRHGLSLAIEETAGSRENSVEPGCQTWISLVQSWLADRTGM